MIQSTISKEILAANSLNLNKHSESMKNLQINSCNRKADLTFDIDTVLYRLEKKIQMDLNA